jgi:hypothetical protein
MHRTRIFLIAMIFFSNIQASFAFDGVLTNATVQVCFTPGDTCTQRIVDVIDRTQKAILMQAYSFTSTPIAKALIHAKTEAFLLPFFWINRISVLVMEFCKC